MEKVKGKRGKDKVNRFGNKTRKKEKKQTQPSEKSQENILTGK